jgi:hypothetical protein
MNAAQSDALNRAQEILAEHFEAHVLIYQHSDPQDENTEIVGGSHSGGHSLAIGMIVKCLSEKLYRSVTNPDLNE